MYLNLLIWLILVAVSVLLGWLTVRAWRAENAIIKWVALTGAFDAQIAPYYFRMAAVCTLGLLLTMRNFFSNNRSI
jgi:hypothetical protein